MSGRKGNGNGNGGDSAQYYNSNSSLDLYADDDHDDHPQQQQRHQQQHNMTRHNNSGTFEAVMDMIDPSGQSSTNRKPSSASSSPRRRSSRSPQSNNRRRQELAREAAKAAYSSRQQREQKRSFLGHDSPGRDIAREAAAAAFTSRNRRANSPLRSDMSPRSIAKDAAAASRQRRRQHPLSPQRQSNDDGEYNSNRAIAREAATVGHKRDERKYANREIAQQAAAAAARYVSPERQRTQQRLRSNVPQEIANELLKSRKDHNRPYHQEQQHQQSHERYYQGGSSSSNAGRRRNTASGTSSGYSADNGGSIRRRDAGQPYTEDMTYSRDRRDRTTSRTPPSGRVKPKSFSSTTPQPLFRGNSNSNNNNNNSGFRRDREGSQRRTRRPIDVSPASSSRSRHPVTTTDDDPSPRRRRTEPTTSPSSNAYKSKQIQETEAEIDPFRQGYIQSFDPLRLDNDTDDDKNEYIQYNHQEGRNGSRNDFDVTGRLSASDLTMTGLITVESESHASSSFEASRRSLATSPKDKDMEAILESRRNKDSDGSSSSSDSEEESGAGSTTLGGDTAGYAGMYQEMLDDESANRRSSSVAGGSTVTETLHSAQDSGAPVLAGDDGASETKSTSWNTTDATTDATTKHKPSKEGTMASIDSDDDVTMPELTAMTNEGSPTGNDSDEIDKKATATEGSDAPANGAQRENQSDPPATDSTSKTPAIPPTDTTKPPRAAIGRGDSFRRLRNRSPSPTISGRFSIGGLSRDKSVSPSIGSQGSSAGAQKGLRQRSPSPSAMRRERTKELLLRRRGRSQSPALPPMASDSPSLPTQPDKQQQQQQLLPKADPAQSVSKSDDGTGSIFSTSSRGPGGIRQRSPSPAAIRRERTREMLKARRQRSQSPVIRTGERNNELRSRSSSPEPFSSDKNNNDTNAYNIANNGSTIPILKVSSPNARKSSPMKLLPSSRDTPTKRRLPKRENLLPPSSASRDASPASQTSGSATGTGGSTNTTPDAARRAPPRLPPSSMAPRVFDVPVVDAKTRAANSNNNNSDNETENKTTVTPGDAAASTATKQALFDAAKIRQNTAELETKLLAIVGDLGVITKHSQFRRTRSLTSVMEDKKADEKKTSNMPEREMRHQRSSSFSKLSDHGPSGGGTGLSKFLSSGRQSSYSNEMEGAPDTDKKDTDAHHKNAVRFHKDENTIDGEDNDSTSTFDGSLISNLSKIQVPQPQDDSTVATTRSFRRPLNRTRSNHTTKQQIPKTKPELNRKEESVPLSSPEQQEKGGMQRSAKEFMPDLPKRASSPRALSVDPVGDDSPSRPVADTNTDDGDYDDDGGGDDDMSKHVLTEESDFDDDHSNVDVSDDDDDDEEEEEEEDREQCDRKHDHSGANNVEIIEDDEADSVESDDDDDEADDNNDTLSSPVESADVSHTTVVC